MTRLTLTALGVTTFTVMWSGVPPHVSPATAAPKIESSEDAQPAKFLRQARAYAF